MMIDQHGRNSSERRLIDLETGNEVKKSVFISALLDTFPRPSGNKIITSVYRKPTHTDRYLDFNSNHPKSAKRAVVRALTDRAKNVCSSPELLSEEMDHLGKVLKYNNYPKWMIDQHGRNSSEEDSSIQKQVVR